MTTLLKVLPLLCLAELVALGGSVGGGGGGGNGLVLERAQHSSGMGGGVGFCLVIKQVEGHGGRCTDY
jgi:hypothetical protein